VQNLKVKSAPWWKVNLEFIGNEKMPLIIIDNFYSNPQLLVNDAKKQVFTNNSPYFPGIRARIPDEYFNPIRNGLSYLIANVFQYKLGLELQEAHYSLTTTPAEQLKLAQRLPHVDGGNDMKIALLHYLCGPEHGGTSFYKQKRTSFETVSHERFNSYKIAIENDHEEYGAPEANYYNESDQRFEKFYYVDAKFNTAIMYFGLNLHAITIGEKSLTEEPEFGRLTINSFFNPL